MDDSLVILGRQPALGLAELESLYGSDKVRPIGKEAAQISIMPYSVAFDRLGGTIKLCKILAVLNTTNWQDIEDFLVRSAPQHAKRMPEGKMQLGLSAYNIYVSAKQIMTTGLLVKKAIRKTGRSVRLTPNKEQALNSAQVIHNRLVGDNGWELVLVRDSNSIICAQTLSVQDIRSYTIRDRERPKRDTRVGMLPPKLAQIIINLASKHNQPEDSALTKMSVNQPRVARLLDPFCGTGVLLQEALLMGYDAYGTDVEPNMIEYTDTNLSWLHGTYHFTRNYDLAIGDATSFQWQEPVNLIASETYLGQPFSIFPSAEKLEQVRRICNVIVEKFLINLSSQIMPGTRICLAIPAWQKKPGFFIHLPLLDHLEKLGYNRLVLKHARTDDLIYFRENQIVARELLIITRK